MSQPQERILTRSRLIAIGRVLSVAGVILTIIVNVIANQADLDITEGPMSYVASIVYTAMLLGFVMLVMGLLEKPKDQG